MTRHKLARWVPLAGAMLLLGAVIGLAQQTRPFDAVFQRGAPRDYAVMQLNGGIGIGTALPTVANSNMGPHDAELYLVITSAADADPRLNLYSVNSTAWRAIVLSTLEGNAPDVADSVWFTSSGFTAEGGTANAAEFIFTFQDPTGDHNARFPEYGAASTYDILGTGKREIYTVESADSAGMGGALGQRAQHSVVLKKLWFLHHPGFAFVEDTGGASCSTTGSPNWYQWEDVVIAADMKGTNTKCQPEWTEGEGLILVADNTDNEGQEWVFGGTATTAGLPANAYAFTTGTDAFYGRIRLDIPTLADFDSLCFGFRNAAAYQDADFTAYDTYACIGLNDASGDMYTYTELNGSNAVATDLTNAAAAWTDGVVKTLDVIVSAAGAVTYQINGTVSTDAVAFSWSDAEEVVPFLFAISPGSVSEGEIQVRYFEADYGTPID